MIIKFGFLIDGQMEANLPQTFSYLWLWINIARMTSQGKIISLNKFSHPRLLWDLLC